MPYTNRLIRWGLWKDLITYSLPLYSIFRNSLAFFYDVFAAQLVGVSGSQGHVGGDGTFQYRTVFDFIAEMTIFTGSFQHPDTFHRVWTVIACSSIVITAVYICLLYTSHGYRNTIYSYRIVDVECRIPDHVSTEQHFIRGTSVACIEAVSYTHLDVYKRQIHGTYVSFSNLLRFGYRTFFRIVCYPYI